MKQSNVQWRHMALSHCSVPFPAPILPPPQPMLLSVWLWILVCGLLLSVSVSGLPPPKADNKYLQEAMSPLISAKKLSTLPLPPSLSRCRRVEIIKRQQGSNLSKFCCLIVVCAVVAVKVLFVYSLRKGMGGRTGDCGSSYKRGRVRRPLYLHPDPVLMINAPGHFWISFACLSLPTRVIIDSACAALLKIFSTS